MWRRILFAILSVVFLFPLPGDVIVVTWNMKWFPSGKADLRAEPEYERENIARAGRTLAEAVDDQRRSRKEKSSSGLVVFAQEMRDAEVCGQYVQASGVEGLWLVSVSNYKDNGGVPLWQQMAIMSTLPVLESGYTLWSTGDGVSIPRGFAFALLDGGAEGHIACFSVHLKSNVNRTGSVQESQKNIYKREAAAGQILAAVRELRRRRPGVKLRILVGGDFNTNEDDPAFVSEATLRSFYGAHYRSCFRDWKKSQCVTHPGDRNFPDATFDYILYHGFERIVSRRIFPGAPVSDHNLVALRLR